MMNTKSALLPDKVICAIGGGKGGVGKSVITVNLGIGLARLGKKVILCDADFGGANLHTLLGINYPIYGLNDFISKAVKSLKDVLINTDIDNLKLISNASDVLNLANPKFAQKEKLLKHIRLLDADFILLDLGAGASFNTLDFFGTADIKIVVVCPETISVQNTYGFLKNAIYRKFIRTFYKNFKILSLIERAINPNHPERIGSIPILCKAVEKVDREAVVELKNILNSFRPKAVINMIEGSKDQTTLQTLRAVSGKYLDLDVDFLGGITFDPYIRKSVKEMKPFLLQEVKSETSANIYNITQNLLKCAHKMSAADDEPAIRAAFG